MQRVVKSSLRGVKRRSNLLKKIDSLFMAESKSLRFLGIAKMDCFAGKPARNDEKMQRVVKSSLRGVERRSNLLKKIDFLFMAESKTPGLPRLCRCR
ncbi:MULTISPECIES: hypothetical protein [unclassified Helicobacter]|uniref:hypothetical protein n=1 Tax=unclassified Helicobacter TaxID=2593540 RepID=UPI00115FE2A1|nr:MULTISPECIES: hypothetical protein [unclassified Helicobacter]